MSISVKNVCLALGILSVLSGVALRSPAAFAQPAKAARGSQAGSIKIMTDAEGVKRFSLNGAPFVPIGVNYLVNGQANSGGKVYKTFNMFSVDSFGEAEIDANLRSISENGFNFVRIWLKGGDTDSGFTSPSSDTYDTARWKAYVRNVEFTIEAAKKYGLHVVLTGSFPTRNMLVPKNYLPAPSSVPANETVAGLNRLILIPQMAHSLGKFYFDLLTSLKYLDPQISSSIFYVDIYNEMHFELDKPPFSEEGRFEFNGRQYNLDDFNAHDQRDPSGRQALMDDATVYFFRTVKSYVTRAAPDVLVTASSGFNYLSGHKGFDGGRNTKKTQNNYMLRPYYELRGGADIIDIHVYTSPARPQYHLTALAERAVEYATADEVYPFNDGGEFPAPAVTARNAPFIAGEYGAEIGKYGVTAPQESGEFDEEYKAGLPSAAHELKATIRQALCPLGFSGYAVWDWQSNKPCCYSLNSPYDPKYYIMRALAPRYSPSYCGEIVDPRSR